MPRTLLIRKAFLAPITWDARRGTIWQHRQCSTPGCTRGASWLIAPSATPEKRQSRFACNPCLEKKYAALARFLWAAPEVEA